MAEVTYKRPATKEPKDKETSQVELSKGGETIKRPLPFELIIPIRTKLIMEQPRLICSQSLDQGIPTRRYDTTADQESWGR